MAGDARQRSVLSVVEVRSVSRGDLEKFRGLFRDLFGEEPKPARKAPRCSAVRPSDKRRCVLAEGHAGKHLVNTTGAPGFVRLDLIDAVWIALGLAAFTGWFYLEALRFFR
jgi:hypothetical protein